MKNLIGKITYYMALPVFWIFLRGSKRSRVFVLVGNEVLLIKGLIATQKWTLPGGGLRRSEDPAEGAVRELDEELKISLSHNQLDFVDEIEHRQNGVIYKAQIFIVRLPEKPQFRRSMELIDAKWFQISNIPDNHSPLLLKALKAAKLS